MRATNGITRREMRGNWIFLGLALLLILAGFIRVSGQEVVSRDDADPEQVVLDFRIQDGEFKQRPSWIFLGSYEDPVYGPRVVYLWGEFPIVKGQPDQLRLNLKAKDLQGFFTIEKHKVDCSSGSDLLLGIASYSSRGSLLGRSFDPNGFRVSFPEPGSLVKNAIDIVCEPGPAKSVRLVP